MKRLKNVFESKEGKKIVYISIIILLAMGSFIFHSIHRHINNYEGISTTTSREIVPIEQKTLEELDNVEKNEALVYRGIWYSDRLDEMVLELKYDGSYLASTWLSPGEYRLRDSKIVLIDEDGNETFLQLMTRLGETSFFHEDSNGELTYFYSSIDLKEESKAMTESSREEMDEIISQKWMDILMQGSWSTKIREEQFFIDFTKDAFVQRKITNAEETIKAFSYRVISEKTNENLCILEISVTDENSIVSKFTITLEETPVNYRLYSLPGMFIWVNEYDKPHKEVQLTQTGLLRENDIILNKLLEDNLAD